MNVGGGIVLTVLLAGVLSFFSPCILPLLPVYIGYFSCAEDGAHAPLRERLLRTLAFVAGISVVFFTLGVGAGLIGSFIKSSLFELFCGIFIVGMGLLQMGIIAIPALEKDRRMASPIAPTGGLIGAFLLGFFFSFGWTPCIGPVLAAILGISLEGGSALEGGALLLIYALGLSVPFMVMALASHLLLSRVRALYPYLGKIKVLGGLIVLIMGIWMTVTAGRELGVREAAQEISGYDTLSGGRVSLSDWEGSIVYLKFWATWCPVCLSGMDEFSKLCEEYADDDNVTVYSVVAPGLYSEMDKELFTVWAKGQELSFPILFDEGGVLGETYGISGYPSSVFLDRDGETLLVYPGHLSNDKIREYLDQFTNDND